MYCQKCYTNLAFTADFCICPKCRRPFDPANPRTFLARPFPKTKKIIMQIVFTTVIAALVAFVVAFFQLAGASGH